MRDPSISIPQLIAIHSRPAPIPPLPPAPLPTTLQPTKQAKSERGAGPSTSQNAPEDCGRLIIAEFLAFLTRFDVRVGLFEGKATGRKPLRLIKHARAPRLLPVNARARSRYRTPGRDGHILLYRGVLVLIVTRVAAGRANITALFSSFFFFFTSQYFTFIKGGTQTDRRRMFNEQRISRGANILFLVLSRVHRGRRSDGGMRPRRTRGVGRNSMRGEVTARRKRKRKKKKKIITRAASKGARLSSRRTILRRRGQTAKAMTALKFKGSDAR